MEIKINTEILQKLREEGFYPDTMMSMLFAMRCLKEDNMDLLDYTDDYNSSKRMVLLYYELLRKGFVEEDMKQRTLFRLTERGLKFLEDLEEDVEVEPVVKEIDESVESWIDEWIKMFPSGVRSGGKLLRSDGKSCLVKMKKFVKDYPYDKETIFKATLMYLHDRKQDDYKYTKCAVYMISKKGEGSVLAEECAKVKDTDQLPELILEPFQINTGLI